MSVEGADETSVCERRTRRPGLAGAVPGPTVVAFAYVGATGTKTTLTTGSNGGWADAGVVAASALKVGWFNDRCQDAPTVRRTVAADVGGRGERRW